MRSVSLALLAVGAGAFAPQSTVRRSTALAVHRPRVAVPVTLTSNINCGWTRGRTAALRPPHGLA